MGIHMTIESQLERLNSKRQVLSLRIYSTMLQCGHELSSWYGVVRMYVHGELELIINK